MVSPARAAHAGRPRPWVRAPRSRPSGRRCLWLLKERLRPRRPGRLRAAALRKGWGSGSCSPSSCRQPWLAWWGWGLNRALATQLWCYSYSFSSWFISHQVEKGFWFTSSAFLRGFPHCRMAGGWRGEENKTTALWFCDYLHTSCHFGAYKECRGRARRCVAVEWIPCCKGNCWGGWGGWGWDRSFFVRDISRFGRTCARLWKATGDLPRGSLMRLLQNFD